MAKLVVFLRGDGTEADRRRTIGALERNTPHLNVCVCEVDADPRDSQLATVLASGSEVLVVCSDRESGAVTDRLAWDVVQMTPGADVVLVECGAAVGPGWRERLRDAAYADAVVATASGAPASMLELQSEEPSGPATGPAYGAALGRPLLGCVFVRREALDIATAARGAARDPLPLEELVLVPGFVHVLAATVVLSATPSPQEPGSALTPGLRRALAEIEASAETLRVTVDLRCCESPLSGTQVHALNLVASLAARDELRLGVLVPARVHDSVRPHLEALPTSVTRCPAGEPIVPSPHVFHRPYQLLTEAEITDVVTAGTRLVVTHQDMILDRTPAYFVSADHWRHYAATTALTFVAADEVVFFSEHARQEAVRDGLVDRAKTSVVPPGTDHLDGDGDEGVPTGLGERHARASPFILVIGNAYFHKNRLFALRVAEELRQAHGWEGSLVLAGGTPEAGASSTEEREFLRAQELAASVVDLPRVTDAERRWLYRHAALVLFPTLYEGFGLVPFEAAAVGTPCVYSSRSSVAEFLPPEGALLELGDVVATARRLNEVLGDERVGAAIVLAIRRAGSELTWSRTADSYVEIYRRSMTRPVGLSLVAGREVIVGAKAQMVSSETERRVLLALRRSAAVRLVAETLVAAAVATRRVARRLSRSRAAPG